MKSTSRREFNVALVSTLSLSGRALATGPTTLESLTATVLKSQKAGLEAHDWRAYIAPWTNEGTWITRRTQDESKHQLVLGYQAAVARIKLLSEAGAPTMNVTHKDVQTVIDASAVTASIRVTTVISAENKTDTIQELYRLQSTRDGWKITNNTSWRTKATRGSETIQFDADYFREADNQVEAAAQQSPKARATALFKALRWREAHRFLQQETKLPKAPANLWAMRAHAAFMLGDVRDAITAVKAGRSRDPDLMLPVWAAGVR